MTHPQVYTPAEDTWLLLAAAERECRDGEQVLEIGCGSGLISASLLRRADVIATDINPHAVREAHGRGVDAVRTDLVSGICGKFDLVLFNPPYLPTAPDERLGDWIGHAIEGGPDGRAMISRFLSEAGRVIAPGGRALLLVSSLTGLPEVCRMVEMAGFSPEVLMEDRVEGEVLTVVRFS